MRTITLLLALSVPILAQVPQNDEFNGASINTSIWTSQIPSGGTISESGGNAIVNVPCCSNHDPSFGGVNQSVRFTQPVTNMDYIITVKFNSRATSAYAQQGILFQQDSTNFIRMELESDDTNLYVFSAFLIGGNAVIKINTPITPASSMWLQVWRQGNVWTEKYSTDGTNFSTIGSYTQTLTVNAIGLYAGNYNATPAQAVAQQALIDFFHYDPVPNPGGSGSDPVGFGADNTVNIPQPPGSRNGVTDCGMNGNGAFDNTTAMQNCINGLTSGQTFYLPNGNYFLSGVPRLAAGHTYQGQSLNAILHTTRSGSNNFILDTAFASPLNITIDTITFDSGAITVNDSSGNGANNFNLHNCQFLNNTIGCKQCPNANYVWVPNGLTHSHIWNNYFDKLELNNSTTNPSVIDSCTGPSGAPIDYDGCIPRSAIWSNGYDNTTIEYNMFNNVFEGIKGCMFQPYIENNITFQYNIFNQVHRIAIEVQDAAGCGHPNPTNPTAQNVNVHHNYMHSYRDWFYGSFGFSWADHLSNGVNYNNNLILSDSTYYQSPGVPAFNPGIGIEIGFHPGHVFNNTVQIPSHYGTVVFSGSLNGEANNIVACALDVGANAPYIGDENNPNGTNTNYHNNFPYYPCENGGNGGLASTTQVGMSNVLVAGNLLTASGTLTTFDPSMVTFQYLIDGVSRQTNTVASYTLVHPNSFNYPLNFNTTALTAGSHTLQAKAVDIWGNYWTTSPQSFTVAGGMGTGVTAFGGSGLFGGSGIFGNVPTSFATINRVQFKHNYPSPGNVATFDSPNTAGNTIIVIGTWGGVLTSPTVSDTQGNTYNAIPIASQSNIAFVGIKAFYATNIHAGANTVTVTGMDQDPGLTIIEYSGIATSNALDAAFATATGASATLHPTSSPFTPSQPGELILAIFADEAASNTLTAGTGYTAIQMDSVHVDGDEEITTSTNQAQAAGFELGSLSNSWEILVLTFKPQAQ